MATPRVFISSTCYDLKYIRENLKYFIRTIGYEPVLSEEGTIFFNPTLHTHDACLAEVPNCQVFVLMIGGRFGGQLHGSETSITNAEYREAVKLKIPVFALIDTAVFNDYHLFSRNRGNLGVDLTKVVFPSVDSIKIFDFIDEVRGNAVNNALVPFRDFGDIEAYLKQQWAGMMFDFLTRVNEERRVANTLDTLSQMNARIEMLSKQILVSVGTEDAKIDATLYEEMLAAEPIRDLAYWGKRPTPLHVFMNSSFRTCARSLGISPEIGEIDEYSIGESGYMSRPKFKAASHMYKLLRCRLIEILKGFGLTPEVYASQRPHINVVAPQSSDDEDRRDQLSAQPLPNTPPPNTPPTSIIP